MEPQEYGTSLLKLKNNIVNVKKAITIKNGTYYTIIVEEKIQQPFSFLSIMYLHKISSATDVLLRYQKT